MQTIQMADSGTQMFPAAQTATAKSAAAAHAPARPQLRPPNQVFFNPAGWRSGEGGQSGPWFQMAPDVSRSEPDSPI